MPPQFDDPLLDIRVPGLAAGLTAARSIADPWKVSVWEAARLQWPREPLYEPCSVRLTFALPGARFADTALCNLLKSTIDGLGRAIFKQSPSGHPRTMGYGRLVDTWPDRTQDQERHRAERADRGRVGRDRPARRPTILRRVHRWQPGALAGRRRGSSEGASVAREADRRTGLLIPGALPRTRRSVHVRHRAAPHDDVGHRQLLHPGGAITVRRHPWRHETRTSDDSALCCETGRRAERVGWSPCSRVGRRSPPNHPVDPRRRPLASLASHFPPPASRLPLPTSRLRPPTSLPASRFRFTFPRRATR